MVVVVGKDAGLKKRVTCRHCANILEYWPSEVRSEQHRDYGGGSDTVYKITCPCGRDVHVPYPR